MTGTEKALRILFIIATISLALTILTGCLPAIICWLAHFLFVVVVIILSIVSFIVYGASSKQKKSVYILIPITILIYAVLAIFVSHNPFVLYHEYTKVDKALKANKSITSYKIIDIYKKNYNSGTIYSSTHSCNYIFNIEANDLLYQAGYCENGTMWTNYSVQSNYGSVSLKKFYEDYQKDHKIGFALNSKKEDIFYDSFTIEYVGNTKEVYEFIKTYKDKYYYNDDYFYSISLEKPGEGYITTVSNINDLEMLKLDY